MRYEVSGTVKLKGEDRKFSLAVEANSERHLRDKVMAHLGSKYRVRRTAITIESVKGGK